MMDQTTALIEKKNPAELIQAIRAGKLEWTTTDLLPYIVDLAGGGAATARSRAATVARTVAWSMGVDFDDSTQGRYVFGQPPTDGTSIVIKEVVKEVPVEKIVVKEVVKYADRPEQSADHDLEPVLKFPETPEIGDLNPKFQTPAWYKRMAAALDAGKHVSLAGPPGIGKSTGPEQYFIKRGQPFVVVNGDAGFRRRDIEGTTDIRPGVGSFFKVAEFAAAAVNGWGCILNEVNAADPDALLWINGILEVPNTVVVNGKAFKVHKDFRLVVTYNPGLIGTKALPQAFKDRFFPVKLGFPPRDFLRKIVISKTGVSPSVPWLDRLLKYAGDCWALHEKGNLRYQISPRRLFDVVFLMETGISTDLEDAIKQAIVDAVDSHADAQMLIKLITSPLAEVGPVSQFSSVAAR